MVLLFAVFTLLSIFFNLNFLQIPYKHTIIPLKILLTYTQQNLATTRGVSSS